MTNFSIIIPTHNRFEMLQKAINSVLSQTYPNYELIVIDDGSTDDTYIICDIFADKVKYIKQENLGVSAARNKGIEIASYDYVAFLDSDDLWLPEKLQEHVNFIQENPKIKIHQAAEKWMRKGRHVTPAQHHIKFEGDVFFESLKRCMITPSTVVIHKSIFEKYGMFDTNLQVCEDYDLWLRISFYEDVGYIDKNLAVRNAGHGDQLSERFEALDRFRLYSILKLLGALSKDVWQSDISQCVPTKNTWQCDKITDILPYVPTSNIENKISAAIETLNNKASILKNGALKRKNFELVEILNKILEIKDHLIYSQIDFQNLLKVLKIEKDTKQEMSR